MNKEPEQLEEEEPRSARNFDMALAAFVAIVVLAAVLIISSMKRTGVNLPATPTGLVSTADENAARHFSETGQIATGFDVPRGIAIGPELRLFVVGDKALHIVNPEGQYTEQKLDGTPGCIGISKDSVLYIGMGDHIVVTDNCGRLQASWEPLPEGSVITSVAVHEDDVWVADAGMKVIHHFDKKGKLLGDLGVGLQVPSPHLDVAVAKDGRVWIANPGKHQLEEYGGEGNILRSWGVVNSELAGFTGCCNPTDFAFLPDGRIVTAEKGIARVKVYSADGVLDALVAGPEDFAPGDVGLDLATDANGRIFVLDPLAHNVRIFSAKQ